VIRFVTIRRRRCRLASRRTDQGDHAAHRAARLCRRTAASTDTGTTTRTRGTVTRSTKSSPARFEVRPGGVAVLTAGGHGHGRLRDDDGQVPDRAQPGRVRGLAQGTQVRHPLVGVGADGAEN
jgi:hypothetical protein